MGRSSAVDANGNFSLTSLLIGTYAVNLTEGGANAVATGVQPVRLTGSRSRIDVSGSSNGTTSNNTSSWSANTAMAGMPR